MIVFQSQRLMFVFPEDSFVTLLIGIWIKICLLCKVCYSLWLLVCLRTQISRERMINNNNKGIKRPCLYLAKRAKSLPFRFHAWMEYIFQSNWFIKSVYKMQFWLFSQLATNRTSDFFYPSPRSTNLCHIRTAALINVVWVKPECLPHPSPPSLPHPPLLSPKQQQKSTESIISCLALGTSRKAPQASTQMPVCAFHWLSSHK